MNASMSSSYVLLAILGAALVTLVLRAVPFAAAGWLRRHRIVHKLGDQLPLAIMVLLVVHTAHGHAAGHAGWPWPELLAVIVASLLQWRLRQPLLSIAVGTVLYMLLLPLAAG